MTTPQRVDVERWPRECDWLNEREFSVHDEPGEHDPCYLVMPGGGSVAFAHHATNGVDQARATFIANACNQYTALLDEVERWRRTGIRIIDGDAKLERDYAALLQQVAELEKDRDEWKARESFAVSDLQRELRDRDAKFAAQAAEIETLRTALDLTTAAAESRRERYQAAERAREEAFNELRYLMGQFEGESFVCNRCGHEESTANCDSALHLAAFLAANGGG